jgi:TetR/AcrR family transcriptional repressor of nem operon
MKTARRASPAKERLLNAAQRLMLAKGFAATTVDEMCAAAGLTKGGFFHHFGSKDELGEAVLEHFVAARARAMRAGSFTRKRDPLKRVYGYLDFIIEMAGQPGAPSGCLLGTFAQELSDTHPRIRAQCARHFAGWTALFKRDLDEAKAKHAPRAALDTQGLAEHFIAVLEGALILAKVKQDRRLVAEHVRHFKRYINSLFEG